MVGKSSASSLALVKSWFKRSTQLRKPPIQPALSGQRRNPFWLRLMAFLPFITRWGRRVDIPEEREAYRQVFRNGVASKYVLPDLAEFCHANEAIATEANLSAFDLGRWHGRNEVWLRIQEELNLTAQELYDIRRGHSILRQEQ